ncbi:Fic family protein [Candidatus Collierbacteria bacterium]|nr:Fic family protein [Candidatus Collierbacteria bacterium]
MAVTISKNPFRTPFLSHFIFTPDLLPFSDEEIVKRDQDLAEFEQIFLNPDIEKNLISKNELLASYAISKAEHSTLTLAEAQNVYTVVLAAQEYVFIREKLNAGKRLTQKDHDKLEFFNIAKTFREFNQVPFSLDMLSPHFIQNLHASLTQGMDVFKTYLSEFTVYKSGNWRDNDRIRVGEYAPAPHIQIASGVDELIAWVKTHPSPVGIAIFHTAFYALHPFHNGNKRICRILEHLLFRSIGLNRKNLYSTSYYYHKEKLRYYKYLLYSLERNNLNHFVNFIQESLMLSMLSVIKMSLESKRHEYLTKHTTGDLILRNILKPLVKREELQFKHLLKPVGHKMARQTFVSNLKRAGQENIIVKRESGRSTYYRLALITQEENVVAQWLTFIKERLSFVPDDFLLA